MSKNRLVIIAIMVTGLVVAGGGVVWQAKHYPKTVPTSPPALTRPSPTPQPVAVSQPAPTPDRMAIVAIRARSYPGSQIATEQNLGDQGGYVNSIVSYQSDGLKIYALWSQPDGSAPAGGWPVIILCHGYETPATYQTNGSDYRSFIAALARAGYVVVKPDYHGHGQSQGQPEGGHFSPVYAYDVLNLIASLKQNQTVNGQRLGLFAHSMGGHEALRTIVASSDVKATVFMAGVVGSFNDIFYNWPNSPAPTDQPLALVQGLRQSLISQYGTPQSDPDFWNSVSAINYVSNITGAVQVNQDAADSVVPKLFADHLVAALQTAHKPVDYYVYPGDDHQFSQNRSLLLQRAIAFYQAHL